MTEYTMESKRKSILLFTLAGLIFLLGIVRGIGGFINLLRDENTFAFLVVSLIMFSLAIFITAIAIFERDEKYFLAGVFLTLIIVFSGAVNSNLLFDVAKEFEIIIDIIAAVIIISLLVAGKKALEKTEKG